jgi:hypothetical protein
MDISPAAILQSIALCQTQALGSLFGSGSGASGDLFSTLLSQQTAATSAKTDIPSLLSPGTDTKGLSPTGRNLALFDPASAYQMMSLINNRDVLYKAQYAELSQMQSAVAQLQAAGQSLGNIGADTSAGDIKAQLQHFVAQYNQWRQSFAPDVQQGGVLAGTQAAEVSLYELQQSVKNTFFGAKDGVHGLSDLGIAIDPATHLATLDSKQLDTALTANPQGAVDALQEFAANFAKSAGLLNADNNFIPNQLDNLSRAIHYVTDNQAALTQEFGTGDPAQPTGKVAQALAAYNQMSAI